MASNIKLPNNSVLKIHENTFHFIDRFEELVFVKSSRPSSSDIGKLFFTSAPKWVD